MRIIHILKVMVPIFLNKSGYLTILLQIILVLIRNKYLGIDAVLVVFTALSSLLANIIV